LIFLTTVSREVIILSRNKDEDVVEDVWFLADVIDVLELVVEIVKELDVTIKEPQS